MDTYGIQWSDVKCGEMCFEDVLADREPTCEARQWSCLARDRHILPLTRASFTMSSTWHFGIAWWKNGLGPINPTSNQMTHDNTLPNFHKGKWPNLSSRRNQMFEPPCIVLHCVTGSIWYAGQRATPHEAAIALATCRQRSWQNSNSAFVPAHCACASLLNIENIFTPFNAIQCRPLHLMPNKIAFIHTRMELLGRRSVSMACAPFSRFCK